jgi:hypothetical protein
MKSIKDLKNSKKGEDIYILGNAPSINKLDLSRLQHKNTIGLNGSPLLLDPLGFSSTYYLITDRRFLQHEEKLKIADAEFQKDNIKLVSDVLKEDVEKFGETQNIYFAKSLSRDGFSLDLNIGFYFGSTTVMLGIQLAYYLGCKNIYLLGVDFTYALLEEKGEQIRSYSEDKTQEFDTLLSVQMKNIADSHLILKEQGVNLWLCSRESLLAPYIPYKGFEDSLK